MAKDKIILIGMMGAGKTTVGKMTADRLHCRFLDADDAIEADIGTTIADYFARFGESAFREKELAVIKRLLAQPGKAVVATGGGAFCQTATREFLQNNGVTVFLDVPEDELLRRLAAIGVKERPMLAAPDWRAKFLELIRSRYPLYREAALAVSVGAESPEQTVEKLVAALTPFPA